VSFSLFTTYYITPCLERQNELRACLKDNLRNETFDRIILLLDPSTPENALREFEGDHNFSKLSIKRVQCRPTYKDWLTLSRDLLTNEISLFSNADIYFNFSLENLKNYLKKPKSFVCLSRTEDLGETKALHPNPHWSQDVWALNSASLSEISFLDYLNIKTGEPRCDNKIAYFFAIHGWDIYNPCYEIQAFHKHLSNFRTYNLESPINLGGMAMVHPSLSPAVPSVIDIDVMVLKKDNLRQIAFNNWTERLKRPPPSGEHS